MAGDVIGKVCACESYAFTGSVVHLEGRRGGMIGSGPDVICCTAPDLCQPV